MPRWVWFLPLGLITVILGLWGFRLGWIYATITETDVIETYAQRYLQNRAGDGTAAGASSTDCVAYPGADRGIWIVVSCGPAPRDLSRHYEYHVNRLGGLEFRGGPRTWGVQPGAGPGVPRT
ncbi:MAG: hypothetical protein AAGF27_07770 [Pseudomonadota bacterium]